MIFAAQINSRLLKHFEIDTILRRALWVPMLAGIALAAVAWFKLETLTILLSGLFCFVAALALLAPTARPRPCAIKANAPGWPLLDGQHAICAGHRDRHHHGAWQDPSARPLASLMAICGILAFVVHRLLVVRVEDPRNHPV